MNQQGMKGALRLALATAAVVLTAAACGSDDPVSTTDMWARPTAPDATNAAFYGTLTNNTEEVISLEEGYSRFCERIELHRSSSVDGVASMEPADASDLLIAPGQNMTFEPLGLHVMCVGLAEPLVEGAPVSLELTFAETGAFVTEVTVEQR